MNGIVLEVLIGSLEPPINGLARRSAEDACRGPAYEPSPQQSRV